MKFTLKNRFLTVETDSLGAELHSVKLDSEEYIWQRDPQFWTGSCPVLFPVCGRLFDGKYTYRGKTYLMDKHGFARKSEFEVTDQTENHICFSLHSNEKTKQSYPFDFSLKMDYELQDHCLTVTAEVCNEGTEEMRFTYGAHPGFAVPFEKGRSFEDYRLHFEPDCHPRELIFTDTCFQTGRNRDYPLEKDHSLRLSHSLFDIDAIFFDHVGNSVTLCADGSEHSVRVDYRGFPYLGIWHKPRSKAPYLCVEPWCGLPSFDGAVDDLESKTDLFVLPGQESKSLSYTITFR